MTISLKQLRYFQAVVETGNYSRAAERLCVAQSAVSRQIKELEEAVQALLLKRTTRQVCLTPAGEAFYQGCQQIIDQLELTLAETRHAERGGLHTMQLLHSSSVPLSGVLLTALRQHLQKHPDLVCEVPPSIPNSRPPTSKSDAPMLAWFVCQYCAVVPICCSLHSIVNSSMSLCRLATVSASGKTWPLRICRERSLSRSHTANGVV